MRRLRSICVSGDGARTPAQVSLFANKQLDFSDLEDASPTEVLSLSDDPEADLFLPVKQARFSNLSSLTLAFSGTQGGDDCKLFFVGFKGVSTGLKVGRQVVSAVYESAAQVSDHPKEEIKSGFHMGM